MEKTHKKRILCYLAALLSFLLAVALDQVTKMLADTYLKHQEPIVLIKGVFELHYLENRGAAFGMFQNCQMAFVIGALIICAAVIFVNIRMPYEKKYMPLRICSVMICAGAIGNLIDRLRLNYVIDFFYFSLIDFPIFNVADCYVVVACAIFIILILFYYKDEDFTFLSRKG